MPSRTRAALPEHVRQMVPADTRPRALTMRLVLPFPPSLNTLYPTIVTSTGKMIRTKSKAGKQYDAAVHNVVGLWINHHQLQPPAPPYRLLLTVWPPSDGRKHDASNLAKCPEDSVMAAIGGDDNDVHQLVVTKLPPDGHPRIALILETIV